MSAGRDLSGLDRDRLQGLLKRCIQCGLCLPHCATYLATGDETRSPRGRLILLGDLVEGREADVPSVLAALDECLGCRACSEACPSGVVHDLLDDGADHARSIGTQGSGLESALRPERLAGLRRLGDGAETVLAAVLGGGWRARLAKGPAFLRRWARLLGSRPASLQPDDRLLALLDGLSGLDSRGARLGSLDLDQGAAMLFRGCANEGLLPGTQARLIALLEAAGVRLDVPDDQTCCGALEAHTGRREAAEGRHARNAASLGPGLAQGKRLVVEAAGCGLELNEAFADQADQVVDAVVMLAGLTLPAARTVPLRVVVHDPCHARHGQGIVEEPRRLLRAVPGLEVLEAEEAEVCCGSGGGYALRHRELSEAMGRRKARLLADSGAQLVVTSNPGCLGQIRDGLLSQGLSLPVLPLSDVIWYSRLA